MIIGFTAKMGVGKSTAIDVIREACSGRAVLVKFAQPLYNMQEALYKEITPVHKRPEDFVKDRVLLQWLGTDWGRNTISKTLWVDLWKAKVKALSVDPRNIILCDDVRFDNEAETIKDLGGTVVKIEGPTRGAVEGLKFHSSESGISTNLVDYVINNDGSKEEFKDYIYEFLKTLENKQ